MKRARDLAALLVPWAGLVALVALAHGRSLGFGFVYDDRWTLLDNPVVHTLANLPRLLGATFARAGVPDAGRPVMLASEMVDWAAGGGTPFVFHAQNLMWHAAVVCLAFATFRRLGMGAPIAWFASALFAVHPLVVEPVAVINYREDLLAAFFTLLALRLAAVATPARVLAAAAATLLGVLAKENATLVPLLFALLLAQGAPLLPALRARAGTLAALVVAVLLGFVWRWWAFGVPGVVSLTAELPAQHRAPTFVLPRAALGFWHGLGQFVLPRGLAPEYPDWPATGLVTGLGWGALALLFALTALALRARARPVALGFAWAALAYLPHLGLVPLTNLRADRYFYLPALGLALSAAALLHRLLEQLAARPDDRRGALGPAALLLAAGLIVALGARSLRQGRIWRDDLAVFSAAVASDPSSQRALVGLSAARLRAGQSLAALESADAALALGEAPRAREMRGIVFLAQGDAAAATRDLQAALREAAPAHRPQVLFNLGLARARAGDLAGARAHLQEAARLAPYFEQARLQLAAVERAEAAQR